MTLKFMGKKRGMTQIFDEKGNRVVCTVISIEPNIISQVKRKETDGYNAIQTAALKLTPSKARNLSKALQGHYAKAGVDPRRHASESRLENVDEFQLGQDLSVSYFSEVTYVDVSGVSKGKGHQGVMKRYHFAGVRFARFRFSPTWWILRNEIYSWTLLAWAKKIWSNGWRRCHSSEFARCEG